MRISRSRAWPATSSSSATRAIASYAWSAAWCGSRTRTGWRRPFRSGSAKRPVAATNCRPRCRACARRSPRACEAAEGSLRWLVDDVGIAEPAAEQLLEYLAAGHAALGCLPTQDAIVFERFFDEVGGMQFVIHSPYGSRINRAWGLALRKRF